MKQAQPKNPKTGLSGKRKFPFFVPFKKPQSAKSKCSKAMSFPLNFQWSLLTEFIIRIAFFFCQIKSKIRKKDNKINVF